MTSYHVVCPNLYDPATQFHVRLILLQPWGLACSFASTVSRTTPLPPKATSHCLVIQSSVPVLPQRGLLEPPYLMMPCLVLSHYLIRYCLWSKIPSNIPSCIGFSVCCLFIDKNISSMKAGVLLISFHSTPPAASTMPGPQASVNIHW